MRRRMVTLVVLSILGAAGCAAVPDVLFSIFDDHYTDSGTTRQEKKFHYQDKRRSFDESGY